MSTYLNMSQESTPGPSSPSHSFLDASSAIDDVTRSFTDYSRIQTPDLPSHVSDCNCNTDDTEYTKAWMAVKAKLESRLVLSAGASHTALAPLLANADHSQRLAKPCYGDMSPMYGGCRFDSSPYFIAATNSFRIGHGTCK